jgi:ABC-2 type transport system ATP-binding protein
LEKTKRGFERQHVLNGISLRYKKRVNFFGIVGRNGSGKSTLLKLLAEIYIPDKGGIDISGSLTPFIELGVGFNHELSGERECVP